ncbi:16S rRNA (uracil(1498)-N(3))-methyltransferase [Oscillospiraceae bacterium HV4-5-C5C]|nr:16S rRNA (uracil(1498)-N(3))-methyltransferase [Oscillospiraceae bacterium HV4-5-C5C]
MSLPRVFVQEQIKAEQEQVRLDPEQLHHLLRVLRLTDGERIELADPTAAVFLAEISRETRQADAASVKLLRRLDSPGGTAAEPAPFIELWQGYPKGSKLEDIIQKSVELGVDLIKPILTERSVARPDPVQALKKVGRWQRISQMAASQSGRTRIPEVAAPETLPQALQGLRSAGSASLLQFVPWEDAGPRAPLAGCLSPDRLAQARHIRFLIGPEGGLSPAEIERLSAAGFQTVSLGKYILRTETAGPAVLAMLNYARQLAEERG